MAVRNGNPHGSARWTGKGNGLPPADFAVRDGRGGAIFRPRTGPVKPRTHETMDASARTLEANDRANELYWGSDHSVNQIADDLDLSKGALYGMIRPLPAALGCPLCGAEVVHPNRTAKDRQRVDCPTCSWDGSEDQTVPHDGHDGGPATEAPGAWAAGLLNGRARTIAGGALLGAAVGLALVMWARRR